MEPYLKNFIPNSKFGDGMLKYNGYIFKENKKWEFFFIYKNFKQQIYPNVNSADMNMRRMNTFILGSQTMFSYVKSVSNSSRKGEVLKKSDMNRLAVKRVGKYANLTNKIQIFYIQNIRASL
jgi:hypothetical protein